MKLTCKNVNETVAECLFRQGEDTSQAVYAEGVLVKFGFHPERLLLRSKDIGLMLSDLPENFRSDKGGGWSFLNACMTQDGEQWGEHRDIDALLALGIATNQASILMPRELWPALPGGMPYFSVTPKP